MTSKLVKLGSLKGPKGDPGFTIIGEISTPPDLDNLIGDLSTYKPKINDAWVIKHNLDDSHFQDDIEYKNGSVWVYRGDNYISQTGITYGPFEYVTNLRGPKGEVSQNIHFAATYNDFVTVDYYNETMKIGDAVIDNGEADFTRMGNMYKIIDISPSEDTTVQNQGKWIEATDLNQIKQNSPVIVVSKNSDNEYYAMEKEADSSYEEINKNCIFLDPGLWNVDGAKFAIYYFNSSGLPNNGLYNSFEFLVKVDGSNIYYTNIEEGWTNCIFVRLNPECEVPSWDYNWGQTTDLHLPASLLETNMLAVTGWGQNDYRWGKYTQESSSTRKINAVNISEYIARCEDGKLCIENSAGISDLSIFFLRYLDTSTRQFSFYDTSYSNNASIYCVKDANIKIGPGDENNEFIFDSNGYFKNKDTGKWIGVYKKQDWRCYDTDPTKNNIKGQTFKVFEFIPGNLLVPSNPKVTIDTNNIISINSVKPNIYYGGKNIEIVDQTTINSVGYTWDKEKRSFAAGENINIATGEYSFAEGDGTEATGNYSHAEGNLSKSTGENSHSEGYKTTASGKSTHSEGYGVEAVGEASHAEGWHNIESLNSPMYTVYQDETDNTKYHIVSDFQGTDGGGDGIFYLMYGMTFLYNNKYYCVTEVFYEDDSKTKPIAFRLNNSINKSNTNIEIKLVLGKSIGSGSHTEGNNTVAYGHYAHAEGNTTRAAGSNSHTEGSETASLGVSSHAEGRGAVAIGDASHAEGSNTRAVGIYSHTEGINNIADGYAAHAEGARNKTTNNFEHAQGYFNVSNTGSDSKNQTISSIGIGHYTGGTESPYNEELAVRKNAVEVMRNGDVYINGIGDYDGTNAVNSNSEEKTGKSLQKVVEELSNGASNNINIATTDEPGIIKVGENLTISEDGTLSASKCPTVLNELIYSKDGTNHTTFPLLYNGLIVQNQDEFDECALVEVKMSEVFNEWNSYGKGTSKGYWGYCDSIPDEGSDTCSAILKDGTKYSGLSSYQKNGEPQDYIFYTKNTGINSGFFSKQKYSSYDITMAAGYDSSFNKESGASSTISGAEDYVGRIIAMNCSIKNDETEYKYEDAFGISLHTLNLHTNAASDGVYQSRPNRAEFLKYDSTGEIETGLIDPDFNSTIHLSCFYQKDLNSDDYPHNGTNEINIPLISFKEGLSIIPNSIDGNVCSAMQSKAIRKDNIITIYISDPYPIKNNEGKYVDDINYSVKESCPIVIDLDNYTLSYIDNSGNSYVKDFSEGATIKPTWIPYFELGADGKYISPTEENTDNTTFEYTDEQIKMVRDIFNILKDEAYIGYEVKSTGGVFFRNVESSLNDVKILRIDDKKVYIKGDDNEFEVVEGTDIFKEIKSGSRLAFNKVTGKLFYNEGTNIYQIASLSDGNSGSSSGGNNNSGSSTPMINVTYSELKSMRDSGTLTAGMQYRITDYVATTIEEGSMSANHPFDIIVTANSANVLDENARAIQHEGDTYFSNCEMQAWKLNYCIDNDTNRWNWADETNGKGVVYRMIDEFNNDVGYDFKGILFKRCKITGFNADGADLANSELNEVVGKYAHESTTNAYFTVDTADFKWFYLFSLFKDDVITDYSVDFMEDDWQGNKQRPTENIYTNGQYLLNGVHIVYNSGRPAERNKAEVLPIKWTCEANCSGWDCGVNSQSWYAAIASQSWKTTAASGFISDCSSWQSSGGAYNVYVGDFVGLNAGSNAMCWFIGTTYVAKRHCKLVDDTNPYTWNTKIAKFDFPDDNYWCGKNSKGEIVYWNPADLVPTTTTTE